MTGPRVAAIVFSAAAAAAVLVVAIGQSGGGGSGGEAAVRHGPPRGVVEDCSTRSEASFPAAFSDPRNVVVGPLVLVGAAYTPPETVREFGGDKFPLLVRAGHRVTVALSRHTRRVAGLGYGPLPEGVELRPRDGHRVVTFIACRRGEPTFWSGFVLTASPRCVPLAVWVDDDRSPIRTTLRMGVPRCS